MKLCKDCKHMKRQPLPGQTIMSLYSVGTIHVAACDVKAIKQGSVCLVTGDVTYPVFESCAEMRAHGKDCGPDGALFEPLPPKRWWEFWK